MLPNALNELKPLELWCLWKRESKTKVPYSPITRRRLQHDKGSLEYMNLLADFETAENVRKTGNYDGFGIVSNGKFCIADLDDCILPDGTLTPEAEEIIRMFNSYTEVSPSGNGIRILVKGKKNGEKIKHRINEQIFELYGSPKDNYATITGNVYGEEKPIRENQNAIDWYYHSFIEKHGNSVKADSEEHIQSPSVEYKHSDSEALNLLLNDPVGSEKFNSTAEGKDHSAEDLALCNKLAFYCNKDKEQMDRLFRSSILFQTMKEEKPGIKKWDIVHDGTRTYGQITIEKACNDVQETYTGHMAKTKKRKNETKDKANSETVLTETGEVISILKPSKAIDVIEKPIDWLVPNWIPQGYVCVMASDGGIGKTTVSASIVAPVSGGYVPAIFNHGNENIRLKTDKKPLVLVLTAEASMSASYKAKLRMYKHCDFANIEYLDCDTGRKNARLGDKELINYIRIRKPVLVVIDPLQSFLPYDADMNSKTSYNNSLEEISKACSNAATALLLITHTNKMSGVYGRNRLNGTSDIWDLARSVMFLNIEGKDKKRIFFSHEKANDAEMQNTIILQNQNGKIEFESEDSENRTDEDFHSGIRKSGAKISVKEECSDSIREVFKLYDTNEMTNTELVTILKKEYGYNDNAIRQAKSFLVSTGEIERFQKGNGKEGSKKEMIIKYIPLPE